MLSNAVNNSKETDGDPLIQTELLQNINSRTKVVVEN